MKEMTKLYSTRNINELRGGGRAEEDTYIVLASGKQYWSLKNWINTSKFISWAMYVVLL